MESKKDKYMDCYNPFTGQVISRTPQCMADKVASAIMAAQVAYPK